MQPTEVVASFVAKINEHDLPALDRLMTDDHVFVDALESRVAGRAAMLAAWERYFRMVPDYWIKVDRVLQDGPVVALFGNAGGTYAATGTGNPGKWSVPAAWLADTRGDRVSTWRVYADNLPVRRLMKAEG